MTKEPKESAGSFTETVVRIIAEIPPGSVLTYGEIAEMAESPRAARQVVRILNTHSRSRNLCWHRVLGKGHVIRLPEEQGGALQRSLLEAEGWKVEGIRLAGKKGEASSL